MSSNFTSSPALCPQTTNSSSVVGAYLMKSLPHFTEYARTASSVSISVLHILFSWGRSISIPGPTGNARRPSNMHAPWYKPYVRVLPSIRDRRSAVCVIRRRLNEAPLVVFSAEESYRSHSPTIRVMMGSSLTLLFGSSLRNNCQRTVDGMK